MNTPTAPSPAVGPRSQALVLGLLVFLAGLSLTSPVAAEQAPRKSTSARQENARLQIAAPPLAAYWSFGNLFSPFRQVLGNKRRMIQFATIAVCIGLYILMRK